VAAESSGIDDPVALELTSDSQSIVVANGHGRSLVSIDLRTSSPQRRRTLEFEPTRLERLRSGIHVLSSRFTDTEPLFILANDMDDVMFVPAVRPR
jgi:hypothetical protein